MNEMLKHRRRDSWILGIILMGLIHSAHALSVTPRSFTELSQEAEVIAVVTVSGQRASWGADGQTIFTFFKLTDIDVIKGDVPAASFELRMPGGVIGDRAQDYPGMPRLEMGGRYVMFIRGHLREFFPIVGVYQGLFRVLRDADGQQRVLRADQGENLRVQALILPAAPTLDAFIIRIRTQLSQPYAPTTP